MNSILVVDDDPDVLQVMELLLTKSGFQVSLVKDGRECLTMVAKELPDLVLLDIMMPGMNGLEVLNAIRNYAKAAAVPVVMHSSVGQDDIVVQALELGADDYITKQSSNKVKVSRIRAILRRKLPPPAPAPVAERITFEIMELEPSTKRAFAKGIDLVLRPAEYIILQTLVENVDTLVSLDQISRELKEEFPSFSKNEVSPIVQSLRKKMGKPGRAIEGVLGVGFRLKREEE